jgi:hypothetical protein
MKTRILNLAIHEMDNKKIPLPGRERVGVRVTVKNRPVFPRRIK